MTEQFGWVCPRCGKSHAPSVRECSCSPAPRQPALPMPYDPWWDKPWQRRPGEIFPFGAYPQWTVWFYDTITTPNT